ncbi:AEC family transporter [Dethiothermospora halolimnae]|uniref:AEC family transporter n=1 Tax=Dethiothermospora halolimnae TaxID=3114390 RepID=UPI003CCBFDE9
MQFTEVLNQAMVLFILLIVGFIIKKLKILTDEFNKGLSNLLINVTLPALIITSMNYKFSKEMFDNSILILIIGIITYIYMIIISKIFTKAFHTEEPQRGVYKFLVLFSNTGFMGYPILNSIYGEIGIFYGAIFNLLFNIMIWTVGVSFVNQEDKKISLRSLINPGIVSVIIGFSLFIFSIKLPNLLYTSLKSLGSTTTPLAMILVGSLLADAKFSDIFKNYRLFIITAIRLFIIPISLIFVLSLFNLPEIVIGVIVIVNAMPAAANAAIFSRKFESDYRLASQGVFLTTLLSIGTIPVILLLLTKFI